jgi:hypothetical protein
MLFKGAGRIQSYHNKLTKILNKMGNKQMVKIEVHVKIKYLTRLIHKNSTLLESILYFMNLCINLQDIFMVDVYACKLCDLYYMT